MSLRHRAGGRSEISYNEIAISTGLGLANGGSVEESVRRQIPVRYLLWYPQGALHYQSGEVSTQHSFRVRYPGIISKRTWTPHLRFGD